MKFWWGSYLWLTAILVSDLQDGNKIYIFLEDFCLLIITVWTFEGTFTQNLYFFRSFLHITVWTFEGTFTSFSMIKSQKESQPVGIKGFLNVFAWWSGSGSVPLTNGSGRSKKQTVPTDPQPDLQHWLEVQKTMIGPNNNFLFRRREENELRKSAHTALRKYSSIGLTKLCPVSWSKGEKWKYSLLLSTDTLLFIGTAQRKFQIFQKGASLTLLWGTQKKGKMLILILKDVCPSKKNVC